MRKLIVAFNNFAKAPKTGQVTNKYQCNYTAAESLNTAILKEWFKNSSLSCTHQPLKINAIRSFWTSEKRTPKTKRHIRADLKPLQHRRGNIKSRLLTVTVFSL